jgi:hypothetical protein
VKKYQQQFEEQSKQLQLRNAENKNETCGRKEIKFMLSVK